MNAEVSGPMILDTTNWNAWAVAAGDTLDNYRRVFSSSIQTPDGRVWTVGGIPPSAVHATTTADVSMFDPATETISMVGRMPYPVAFAGILSFPDNSVEIYGGVNNGAAGTDITLDHYCPVKS